MGCGDEDEGLKAEGKKGNWWWRLAIAKKGSWWAWWRFAKKSQDSGEVKKNEALKKGAERSKGQTGKPKTFNTEPVHRSFGLDRDRTEDRK